MTGDQLRQNFLDFFKEKGHAVIPSASLVPENDPSVLFNTAGMQPLVPNLLGDPHPAGKRLVDSQKCLRTVDIDEVGDNSHLTFFEMLGNWSLGDYFKQDSIKWSYEFLVDKLELDPKMLAVSVYQGDEETPRDEESAELWKEMGIAPARIAYLDKEENWWPAGGENFGPQGPDTEIFYWTGEGNAPEVYDPKDEMWVEIWNNVFMQFNNTAEGLKPLVQKNVDTGMGLERTVAILNGVDNVYETDLFLPIMKAIEDVSGASFDSQGENVRSFRIIADHLRAATFVIADGIEPSNVDQGYVLRRLIRRAIRHGRQLGIDKVFCASIARTVIDNYKQAYPELSEYRDRIIGQLDQEEEKFQKTLVKGLKEFEKRYNKGQVSGEDAFILYSTYGFPLELTEELAREQGQEVDREKFEEEFKKHQELSRAGAGQKFTGGLADHSEETVKLHTATHLLHQALRQVLGDHVYQKGSNINPERLRFDFSHSQKVTKEELEQVEGIVNEQIEKDLPVHYEILDLEKAKELGAIGVFEDKYAQLGNDIKVYMVGDKDEKQYFSMEVCGGPHVEHLGELGEFKIKKEEASSAGVRRIKAILT